MIGHLFDIHVPYGIEGIAGAFNIINDPRMCRLITSLVLAGANDEEIELAVNGKFDIDYSLTDITEYMHYFFNLEKWNFQEKQKYVDSVTDTFVKKYYKMALKGDKEYLIWKLGAAPNKSQSDMLQDLVSDAYYNFKEWTDADPDTALKWGALTVKLMDRFDKVGKDQGNKESVLDTISFEIKVTTPETKTVHGAVAHISELGEEDEDD